MNLSLSQCIEFGWRTLKARPWFFVGATLILIFIVGVCSPALQAIVVALLGKGPFGRGIAVLVSFAINILIGLGSMTLFLKAHDAVMSATLSDLWNPKLFWNYLGTYVLLIIIVVIGLILLIVPGIILALTFSFAGLLVVDRGLGPIEALKESARITKGHRWFLLGLGCAVAVLNILGLLVLIVGLLVTVPISVLAVIHAYREFSGKAAAPTNEPLPTPTLA